MGSAQEVRDRKAAVDVRASDALVPLGWEWHSLCDIDRLRWRFVALPSAAWLELARSLDPLDLRQDTLREAWVEEHGVRLDREPTPGMGDGQDDAEGMRLLVERALEKARR